MTRRTTIQKELVLNAVNHLHNHATADEVYICSTHYHIRCCKCDRVFDVDMEEISDLRDKVKDKHGFNFLNYDIIFQGICPDCQKE